MNRNYKSGEQSNIDFFYGKEVEHTPAYGQETLFVVGVKSNEEIVSHLSKQSVEIDHIFFGANHSFNPCSFEQWNLWSDMIKFFLKRDYLCSLDIPINLVEEFLETGLNEFNNFIPQIRVPIPFIEQWNYNTMLKLDDKGFKATNPGVWTHSLYDLKSRNKFTNWNAYKNDEIVP